MKVAVLNTATPNASFEELDTNSRHFKERCYFLVPDDYDFAANASTEITGADGSEWESILKFYGRVEIGMEVVSVEKDLIKDRKRAGINAYQETQAGLRLSRLSSGAPHSMYKDNIYDPMSKVIKNVESGDWINAYEEVNLVTSNAVLTVEMIAGFRLQISDYLLNSGKYIEFTGYSMDATGMLIAP